MNKLVSAVALAALLGASASANAWWGGPGGWGDRSFMDDFFGDGWGDFNMNMSGGGRGWGRGYNRYNDYYGYGPYGWGAPYAYGAPYGYGAPYAYPYAAPVAPQSTASAESK